MSDFYHFNAFPETLICYPELDNNRLQVCIPLITDSYDAIGLVQKKPIDNGILDILYSISYKPKKTTPVPLFKFISFKLDIGDLSQVKFIRHRLFLIETSAVLAENLSDRPFGATIYQDNIPEIPSFNFPEFFDNPGLIGESEEQIENIARGNVVIVDSCTIPPGGTN